MSFGIVRVQKIRAGSVKGIQIHDQREKEYSHTNPDIDFSKSCENYDLHNLRDLNFTQDVKRRIDELDLKRAVRKDAVMMVQVLVTSDRSFFDKMTSEQQEQFFNDSYEFLKNRYGEKNVISSIVHFDERTPHMHFNFVPVTEDGRLSAKSVLNRFSLIDQQDEFFKIVGGKYGLDRGERGGKRNHLKTLDFKVETLQREKDALECDLRHLKGKTLSYCELESIKPEKTITGAIKGISVDEVQSLKKVNLEYQSLKRDFEDLSEKYKKLNNRISSLDLKSKYHSLEKENKHMRKNIKHLREINPDVYEKFFENKERSKKITLSRNLGLELDL